MALWKARYAFIKIGSALSDPGASSSDFWTLATALSDELNIEKVCKSITFKEPERDSETILLVGATSGAQNAELDEKSNDNAELTCTLILNPETSNEFDLEKFKLTVHTTLATGWDTRYNYASAVPTGGVSVTIQFTDGTSKINYLLNNASITTLGGFSLDADGHAEQEIKVVCAPDDCWKEENFTTSA